MLVCNPYEVVIQGLTSQGKTFRPSDWAERLCGILSSFDSNRLSYHDWVRPILVDNVRCVAVDKKLEQINPAMFHFLMDFAHDNDLRILDCKALLEEQSNQENTSLDSILHAKAEAEKAAAQAAKAEQQRLAAEREAAPIARELPHGQWHDAHPLLQRNGLCPQNLNDFLQQAAQLPQQRLIAAYADKQIRALALFHTHECLLGGRQMQLDVLCADEDIAPEIWDTLIEQLAQTARQEQCRRLSAIGPTGEVGSFYAHILTARGFILDSLALRRRLN